MAGLHRPFFLTGMMGAGKSTVGRLLAEKLGVDFIDLDRRIERLFGEPVATMLADSETRFRERESLALVSLLDEPGFGARGVVIATGGGTVIAPANRAAMCGCGVVIFLDAPTPVLAARLLAGGERAGRPLLAGTDAASSGLSGRLGELYAARTQAYRDGSVRVDATGTESIVVERLLAALDGARQSSDTQPGTQAV